MESVLPSRSYVSLDYNDNNPFMYFRRYPFPIHRLKRPSSPLLYFYSPLNCKDIIEILIRHQIFQKSSFPSVVKNINIIIITILIIRLFFTQLFTTSLLHFSEAIPSISTRGKDQKAPALLSSSISSSSLHSYVFENYNDIIMIVLYRNSPFPHQRGKDQKPLQGDKKMKPLSSSLPSLPLPSPPSSHPYFPLNYNI